MKLTQLKAGDTGLITAIEALSGADQRKLIAFGVMPGALLQVLQTVPVYVVRIENTELALDCEMARTIVVRRKF